MPFSGIAGAMLAASVVVAAQPAQALVSDRIAIIDASTNLSRELATLKNAGVEVVGRYLGRCPEWAGKRLIDSGDATNPDSEVRRIHGAGIAIMSIYQYLSRGKEKFDGRYWKASEKRFVNLPAKDCKTIPLVPHDVKTEAELDADGALDQARRLGQPAGSAIFFGMDFNFDPNDADTKQKMLTYFTIMSRRLRAAKYLVGAYGSGSTLELLLDRGLIDRAWLSPSRSYAGSSAFHSSGRWHLFQAWADSCWFGRKNAGKCRGGIELDTNIQNKAFAGTHLGFWNAKGPYRVDPARVRAVYDGRRFVCNGNALVRRDAKPDAALIETTSGPREFLPCEPGLGGQLRPQMCYATVVHVGRSQNGFVEVDHDDDGRFDGWTESSNLTRSFAGKPLWIEDGPTRGAARRAAKCN